MDNTQEEDKTVFLNNDEANMIFRICTNHGVEADIANKIAIDVGEAYSRTLVGKVTSDFHSKFAQWSSGIITAVLGAATLAVAWFLDLINLGGGA